MIQSEVLAAADAASLAARALASPTEARQVLGAAIDLREVLFRIFAAVAEQRAVNSGDLRALSSWARRLELGNDFAWHWGAGDQALDAPLAPLVRVAVELLTSANRRRVRTCAADDCAWLFLDTSKNKSRRWCDMKQCGNRDKARRFYARHRHGDTA